MSELVMLAMPGGPGFVEALQRVWDRGDAAFPLDLRLPPPAREAVISELAPSRLIDEHGDEAVLDGGRPVDDGDALVVATSGTTGRPKGVVLTHDAVAASAAATNRRLGVTAADHWLACLPLAHVGGLSVITRALHGGTALTVLPGFDAAAVQGIGATHVSLVATALRRIDPTRFRVILLGGSRPPVDRPPNAIATYGMTETGSGVVYDGRPLDDVEVAIVDGEVLVRGPMLLRCYRDGHDPRTPDGWFPTGDLGHWRDDGRLHVEGRRGDLIITGGENVWPEAVEAVISQLDAVRDVAVTSRPDPEWGDAVVALVVSDDVVSVDVVRGAVKERLPAHQAPREVIRVSSIPRTNLGKIARASLRELLDDGANLNR